MKFEIVQDRLRDQVRPSRGGVRSEWVQALLDGKTIKISREDRDRIGGNSRTLRNHGLRLRTGLINDDEVLVWGEPLEGTVSADE